MCVTEYFIFECVGHLAGVTIIIFYAAAIWLLLCDSSRHCSVTNFPCLASQLIDTGIFIKGNVSYYSNAVASAFSQWIRRACEFRSYLLESWWVPRPHIVAIIPPAFGPEIVGWTCLLERRSTRLARFSEKAFAFAYLALELSTCRSFAKDSYPYWNRIQVTYI